MHPVICGNCDKKWYAAGHTPVSWFGGWACSRACDIANCIRELLTIQDVEQAASVEGLCRERVDRNWGTPEARKISTAS